MIKQKLLQEDHNLKTEIGFYVGTKKKGKKLKVLNRHVHVTARTSLRRHRP